MTDVPLRIIPPGEALTADEARTLTVQIRNHVAELEMLLVRAYHGRVWVPLGYGTWDEWLQAEFKAAPLALPREERRAASQSLAGWGLSTRAIAAATGVSQTQADRDSRLTQKGSVTGLDGRAYVVPARVPAERPPATPTVTCPTCHGTGKVRP